jgi:hypothetical protein
VVQCDRHNGQIHNTILAMITGNATLVGREPTQFLIDPATPERAPSGLSHPFAVKCENLMTVPQADIIRVVGRLSDVLKQLLDECLKLSLELP